MGSEIQHSDDCRARFLIYEAQAAAYDAQYPDYCRVCNGAGQLCETFDPSPAGVSLSAGTMTDCSPCMECAEWGLCPRCTGSMQNDGAGPCDTCGFKIGDAPRPEAPECYCGDIAEANHNALMDEAYEEYDRAAGEDPGEEGAAE